METFPELLRVAEVQKTFFDANESKAVLSRISFSLSMSDSLAVVGPSGCGKTTLILMIAGLLPATGGAILFGGEAVEGPNRKIALVLQHYGLFPWKTVAANIMLGARLQKIRVSDEELMDVKRALSIEDIDHLYPDQLSGGQRQRVALARAVLLRPSLLLLDEPFAAIDTITRERLQGGLVTVFNERRFSFIIVTHNIEEAVFLGRRIIVLENGAAGIKTMLDNPGAGDPGYRNSPEFFKLTLALRNILEELT